MLTSFSVKAGKVCKVSMRSEAAKAIRTYQQVNGFLKVSFGKLRFHFEGEEKDPEENECLVEAMGALGAEGSSPAHSMVDEEEVEELLRSTPGESSSKISDEGGS